MNKNNRFLSGYKIGLSVAAIMMLIASFATLAMPAVTAANDMQKAQGIVDKARVTFQNFMNDSNFTWIHQNMDRARGILIYPQVLKGGFIFGASGGTGVLVVREERTGSWSEPAFYTIGSVTFGLQIGGEAAEVIVVAMTQKAIDSLLSSSFKLGGDTSVALGPVGAGAKASMDLPSVTADFVSFARSKGLYGGLNLEGAVVAVRDSLNKAYYVKHVVPADIVVKHNVTNPRAAQLQQSLKCKC
jgi:lipid-binding SYLF domain-containing protein